MDKLPRRAGISLSPEHYQAVCDTQADIAWLEVCSEDLLGLGGEAHHYLERIAARYPVAMHSTGLSLGSAESVNPHHLSAIKTLVDRYQPAHFSEHLAWCRWQGTYFNQLMPLPYTEESLDHVCINIKTVQNALGRRILLENAAVYSPLLDHTLSEGEFFSALVRNTGCGVLLDLNSLYITCQNDKRDPFKELASYPLAAVKEIHLGGHCQIPLDDNNIILVDEHSTKVCKPVWQLYRDALVRLPMPVPTLIEWNVEVPELKQLIEQAKQADKIIMELSPPEPENSYELS